MKIVIPTCDKYIHLMEGLLYTFRKFWKEHPPIVVLGYNPPTFDLGEKCEFFSLGEDKGPNNFSDDLMIFFKTYNEEYFINFIDDTILLKEVDNNQVNKILGLMKRDNIGKSFLSGRLVTTDGGDTRPECYTDYENNIVEVNQDILYRSSLGPSIWKTSLFMDWLKPGLSPWSFETSYPINDGVRILSTIYNHPMSIGHLYRGGQLINKWYEPIIKDSKSMDNKLDDESIQVIGEILKINK